MKKILNIFLLAFALSACVEEIPLDKLDKYNEKLVVNEYFNNNEPFSIQVSISKDAYKESDDFRIDPSKTTVVLTEDNVPMNLSYNNFTYTSDSMPKPGKLYKLTISNPGFNTVTTSGILPAKIASKNATYIENGGIDMQGNQSDLLKLTFKDDGNTVDYYKLNFFYYSELVGVFTAFDFEPKDILSAVNTTKTRDGGFLFSDKLFNGMEKTLTAVPPFGIVASNTDVKYLIQIQRLNDDFWKYNTSLEQYRGGLTSGGNGSNVFGGAVVVYTNIKDGLGIFAGSNIESDTLR